MERKRPSILLRKRAMRSSGSVTLFAQKTLIANLFNADVFRQPILRDYRDCVRSRSDLGPRHNAILLIDRRDGDRCFRWRCRRGLRRGRCLSGCCSRCGGIAVAIVAAGSCQQREAGNNRQPRGPSVSPEHDLLLQGLVRGDSIDRLGGLSTALPTIR